MLLASYCTPRKEESPNPKELVGIWQGSKEGHPVKIVLNEDGTFDQKLEFEQTGRKASLRITFMRKLPLARILAICLFAAWCIALAIVTLFWPRSISSLVTPGLIGVGPGMGFAFGKTFGNKLAISIGVVSPCFGLEILAVAVRGV